MSDNLINLGMTGLSAAQWGIKVTGENLSNATTPGYSVETPQFQEAPGQYTPSGYNPQGVNTTTVTRGYSQYLTAELNNAQAQSSSLSAYYTMIGQLNNYVGSPTAGISSSISSYFSGLQNVANSAGSLATRQTAISDAQTLASQLNAAGQQYDQLRQSVNTQLSSSVTQINTYTAQLAQLNQQIATASAGSQPPNQLLDQRDQAVSSLAQLVGVNTITSGTSVSVYLSNGQPLVVGTSNYALAAVTSPGDPSELSIAASGATGSASANVQTVLPDSAVTGGTVGGLLAFRTQTLDPSQAKLGAIATSFAAQVNAQNALGIDLSGNPGGNLFNVAAPAVYANANNTGNAALSVSFANAAQPTTGDYTLSYDSSSQYVLTDNATGTVLGTSATLPASIGGLNLNLTGGAMNVGDAFSVLPTRGAPGGFSLATANASQIAAAAPLVTSPATSNGGTGTISAASVTAGYQVPSPALTLTYDAAGGGYSGFPVGSSVLVNGTAPAVTIASAGQVVPYSAASGATFTITSAAAGQANNVTVSLAGSPVNGDRFTVGANAAGSSDGSNANALSNLVNAQSFTGGMSLTSAYAGYVNAIGNTATQINASNTAQTTLVTQITAAQQSVSGVNQNEEAANLMQYQQLYQANAKVIQTASTLFQTLMSLFN